MAANTNGWLAIPALAGLLVNMADGILTPCNVACGSGIVTVNSPSSSGMTCHSIRPNVRHIGILHLVSISTYHRSRHVIVYQAAKFYQNRITLTRKK